MAITEELAPAASTRAAAPAVPTRAPGARAPHGGAGAGGWDRGRWAMVAVVALALSPFVVGAVEILHRGFPPGALFGDRAILALTARDAFRAPVLLGPYSRFYWHHPGPLYFYVLQAWSWVFGGSTVSLVLGATAINVAGAAGILALAHRRGGRPLLVWTALLLGAYLVALDPIPFDIWNPSVTVLPFVALLLLAWSVACRDWWAMPWLALVASFVVQTHVGLAPGAAAAIGSCAVLALVRQRRHGPPDELQRRTIGRAALVSALVALVAWLPPIVQELTSGSGNLSALLHFFTQQVTPHPLSDGLTQTGLQTTLMLRAVFTPVTLREDYHQGLTLALVVTVVACAVALYLARRARSSDTLALFAVVAVELVAGVYAVTRIQGAIQFYLVQWISAVGFVLWMACGHAVIASVRERSARADVRAPRWARLGTVVVLVVLCVSTIHALPGDAGRINEDLDVPNNRALFGYVPARQLLAATHSGETVTLRPDSVTSWEVLAADALLLAQHGRDVHVVATKETRLLFDDALLVSRAPAGAVLAFRDRPQRHAAQGSTFLADQGRWTIVTIARG